MLPISSSAPFDTSSSTLATKEVKTFDILAYAIRPSYLQRHSHPHPKPAESHLERSATLAAPTDSALNKSITKARTTLPVLQTKGTCSQV